MADTIQAGGLSYALEADTSKFTEGMKTAEQAVRNAAAQMALAFQTAATAAEGAIERFAESAKVKLVGMAVSAKSAAVKFGEIWSEGADAADKAVTAGFNAIGSTIDSVFNKLVSKAGPWGAALAVAWNLGLGDIVKEKIGSWVPAMAGYLDSMLGSVKGFVDDALDHFGSLGQWVKEKFDGIADGASTGLRRIAGTLDEVTEAGQKLIDKLKTGNERLKEQYNLLGLSAAAAARMKAEMEVDWNGSAADTRALKDQIDKRVHLAELIDAETKSIREHEEMQRAGHAIGQQMAREAKTEAEHFTKSNEQAEEALKKSNEQLAIQLATLGLSEEAAARLKADFADLKDALSVGGGDRSAQRDEGVDLTARIAAKKREMREQEEMTRTGHAIQQQLAHEAKADADKAAHEAEQYADQYEHRIQAVTSGLERQAEMQERNADAIRKTAYQRSLEQSQAQARGTERKDSVADTPEVIAKQLEAARRAQASADKKYGVDLEEAVRRQTEAYTLQTASLGANVAQSTAMKLAQDQENQARKDGVIITDDLRAKIDASASALGQAAQKAAEAKDAYDGMMKVGTTMASSLESAFSKFTQTGKFSFSDMVKSMLADMEKLAFRAALMPIFGGGTANPGGLLGSLLGGALGLPGRADGGPVGGGSPYIVGERGPELFVPRSAGTIIPNNAISGGAGGGGGRDVNFTINLAGANGDETIARLASQAARQAFAAAVETSRSSMPAAQRRYQMLGA